MPLTRRAVVLLVQASHDDGLANVTEYDVVHRACELYLARNCEDRHDVDDWLHAEREL